MGEISPNKGACLRSENAAYDYITINRDEIVKEYREQFLAPELEVGDGLIFSEDVLHRTYVTPEMITTSPDIAVPTIPATPGHRASLRQNFVDLDRAISPLEGVGNGRRKDTRSWRLSSCQGSGCGGVTVADGRG